VIEGFGAISSDNRRIITVSSILILAGGLVSFGVSDAEAAVPQEASQNRPEPAAMPEEASQDRPEPAAVQVVIEESDNIYTAKTGRYSLKEGDCSVMWEVEVPRDEDKKITLRTRYPIGIGCSLSFEEQLPLHRRVLKRLLEDWDSARFSLLFTGPFSRLDPAGTWNLRIALAAASSADWKEYCANYPNHGHGKTSNTIFVETVNSSNACRELAGLFAEFGMRIRLDSVEKVFAQKAKDLPFHQRLKTRGVEDNPNIFYDAGMNYFKISPGEQR